MTTDELISHLGDTDISWAMYWWCLYKPTSQSVFSPKEIGLAISLPTTQKCYLLHLNFSETKGLTVEPFDLLMDKKAEALHEECSHDISLEKLKGKIWPEIGYPWLPGSPELGRLLAVLLLL